MECRDFTTIQIGTRDSTKTLFFDALLMKSLDHVFSMFGKKCSQLIYQHAENRYGIQKTDIPSHIPEFTRALEELFGKSATILMIAIMKDLHGSVPIFEFHQRKGELSFIKYLDALRIFCLAN